VEGLEKMDPVLIKKFHAGMLETISGVTSGKDSGHIALKFTALISLDVMTRLSSAQKVYMDDILKFNQKRDIDVNDLKNSLQEIGISFDQNELNSLFDSLKFESNKTDKVSNLEIYANAHLFILDIDTR
jgi:hypothetical protein